MQLKNIIRTCGLFLIIVFGIGIAQSQQQTGNLKGTVSDNQGQQLPGVLITITSPVMTGERVQVTNAEGRYRFLELPPGNYELTAELEGFATVKRTNIRIQLGQTITVDIAMTVSTMEELE